MRKRFDAGLVTVEYALVALGAAVFAGVLIAVVKSDAVRAALSAVIIRALG